MVNISCALLIIVLALASADATLIFDASDVKATPGTSLALSCGVKEDFRLCFWDHEDGRSFQVEDVHAGVHPGLRAPEDLIDNQCGVVIDSVSVEDSGAWTCRVFLADNGGELRNTKIVAACHDPFTYVSGGCFYFHSTEGLSWSQGRDYCQSLTTSEYYSDLATVQSCDQLGEIWQHIVINYENPPMFFIGGTDVNEEGNWHWVTGGTVPRSAPFWYPRHPQVDTTRNCLYIQAASGYFADASCSSVIPCICEEFSYDTGLEL
uniref:Pattern recognition receptor n=1 Tax=Procambarus clarkii TaxID=6728 RepID=A0AAU7YMM4_PROCL|nr:uncharacterized protein LOC123750095 isoform X1 [Procambarus clarkii]